MKLFLALLLIPTLVFATSDPLMAELRAQNDIDSMLSRMMDRQHYLVQVTSDIVYRPRKKAIEGEVFSAQPEEPQKPKFIPMPGFVPEPESQTEVVKKRDEGSYQIVEVPTLSTVKVQILVDERISEVVVSRAKVFVQQYLKMNFPGAGMLYFGQFPTRNLASLPAPSLVPPVTDVKKEEIKPEVKKEEPPKELAKKELFPPEFKEYLPWGITGACFFLLALSLITRRPAKKKKKLKAATAAVVPPPQAVPQPAYHDPFFAKLSALMHQGSLPPADKAAVQSPTFRVQRKRVLEKFLFKSEGFRQYYLKLGEAQREELNNVMNGTGFNSLLAGLGLPVPPPTPETGEANEEQLATHEKNFEDFVQIVDWQERQLFGFLQHLSNEQLVTLAKHEDPLGVCFVLRYLKPEQSALVLDSLDPSQRERVMAQLPSMKKISLSELDAIEKQMRMEVHRLPRSQSGENSDAAFWGKVISRSENQEPLLAVIERTDPGIYPSLKKYRFRLEDIPSLPVEVLERVISDADNEELGLALAGTTTEVAKNIFNVLSPKRKELIQRQLMTYQSAPKEKIREATSTLTQRLREAA